MITRKTTYHITITGDNPLPEATDGRALAAEMLTHLWSHNERVAPQSLALAARRSWSAWEYIGLPHSARETLKSLSNDLEKQRREDDAFVVRAIAHYHRAVQSFVGCSEGNEEPMTFAVYLKHYSLDQAYHRPAARRYADLHRLSPATFRKVYDTFLDRRETACRFGDTYVPEPVAA